MLDGLVEKNEKKPVSELHFDHLLWVNQLRFFKDELAILENRLSEVSSQRKADAAPMIEHFQNQFIREREVIDILIHDINDHEHVLAQHMLEHPADETFYDNHSELESRMQVFGKIWFELKGKFSTFLKSRLH